MDESLPQEFPLSHHKKALEHFLRGLAGMYGVQLRILEYSSGENNLLPITEWIYSYGYFRAIDNKIPPSCLQGYDKNKPCPEREQHLQSILSANTDTTKAPTIFHLHGGPNEFSKELDIKEKSSGRFFIVGGRTWERKIPEWERAVNAYRALEPELKEPRLTSYAFRAVRLPVRSKEELDIIALGTQRILNLFISDYLQGWSNKLYCDPLRLDTLGV